MSRRQRLSRRRLVSVTPEERLAEVARLLGEGARLVLAKKRRAEQAPAEQPQQPTPDKAEASSRS